MADGQNIQPDKKDETLIARIGTNFGGEFTTETQRGEAATKGINHR
jgi:hypothetical protein